jgi:phage terminase large subunit
MKRHGFPKMTAAIKGARSLEEGVEFLQTYDIVVHPRCKHTVQELTAYSFEVDEDSGAVLPKLADKDNHVIDALRYANEAARRAKRDDGYDYSKSAATGRRV